MEDLIRRSDALSCFHDLVSQRGDHALLLPIYGAIASLPSALPKPHVRLIDADALESNGWYLMRVNIKDGKYEVANLMIAPTIIPAEEGE